MSTTVEELRDRGTNWVKGLSRNSRRGLDPTRSGNDPLRCTIPSGLQGRTFGMKDTKNLRYTDCRPLSHLIPEGGVYFRYFPVYSKFSRQESGTVGGPERF